MSRGLGAVQRAVLDKLATNTADPMNDWDDPPMQSWTTVDELAHDTTRSAVESTRRAVIKLADAGKIDLLVVRRQRPYNRMKLVARLLLAPDVAEVWQAKLDEHREGRRRLLAAHGIKC